MIILVFTMTFERDCKIYVTLLFLVSIQNAANLSKLGGSIGHAAALYHIFVYSILRKALIGQTGGGSDWMSFFIVGGRGSPMSEI